MIAVAVSNPLAAVCLCRVAQTSAPAEHACCHKPAQAGPAIDSVPGCCHTEQADHGAARLDSPLLLTGISASDSHLPHLDLQTASTTLTHSFVPFHRVSVLRA